MSVKDHHIVNELNRSISIVPLGDRSPCGAFVKYNISVRSTPADRPLGETEFLQQDVTFHMGDPKLGCNGFTHEAYLAILIDRLRDMQGGALKCRENAIALTHLEEAMLWMYRRSIERTLRGVEGKQIA